MNFNKYKIKRFAGDIETHEVFLDALAKSKEEELGISEKKLEVPIKERMSYIILGIFLLLAFILFSKTFYLQVVEGKKLNTISLNNKGGISLIIPERGIIYDKNFKKLVSNSPAFDLVCDRRQFLQSSPEILNQINNLAAIMDLNPEELKKKIEISTGTEVIISENISQEKLLILEGKINELKECHIDKNTKRNYLFADLFSHLLGYTGRINENELENAVDYASNDYIGKVGIEKFYESYLRGNPGKVEEIRTATGVSKGQEVIVEPISGNNLVLNVDFELQEKLYNYLEERLEAIGAKKAAAVAMDPRTGAVLALVSFPSYDNNLFSGGISWENYEKLNNDPNQPLFNRSIQAHYPTGSTIKPFEAAAALQEKLISPTKQINDPGYLEIRNKNGEVVQVFRGVSPHGLVDMKKALAVSSNIYFYTIGGGYGDQQGLGPTKIKEYLSLFGWDQKTGVDLPGEYSGFIPDPAWKKKVKGENWWDGDNYNLSIGQSDLQTTPLQVATAYCAIANNGTLYKPQIVNKIISGPVDSGEVIKEFLPEVIRANFIDTENLEIVRQGMRDGVTEDYGISRSLKDLPVAVAAKTGTAEIGYKDRFNVWSSVFAPYENPEIVLVITVESVDGLGSVTLPVAKDILNWYFSENK